jgi:hypothetical protein
MWSTDIMDDTLSDHTAQYFEHARRAEFFFIVNFSNIFVQRNTTQTLTQKLIFSYDTRQLIIDPYFVVRHRLTRNNYVEMMAR